ncbi:hypothetical protein HYALB_00001933 [Hymenoscyphus albidus]|uniref:Cytochrome P450 monooxygenase n=1 Tax=Hymenoscyphus albidus TaxID=595503 RepID=A0A9N9Q1X3_9HELO|nr:hypothetical protein HYALB_00001933 [Hymenoscyphus albidus]
MEITVPPNFNLSLLASTLLILIVIYKYILTPLFLSPLSRIPSAHPSCHIFPVWINYIRFFNIENGTLFRLHQQKGPILRIGPNELSINCYEGGIKTIFGGGYEKTSYYPRRFAAYNGTKNMFTTQETHPHSIRKRMLSNIYSKSHILTSPTIQTNTLSILHTRFLPLLHQSADTQMPLEVLTLSYAYAMDFFTAYQFGRKLSSNFLQDVDTRTWYLGHFFASRPYLYWITEQPQLAAFLGILGVNLVPRACKTSISALETWNILRCEEVERLLAQEEVFEAGDTPSVYSHLRRAFQKVDPENVVGREEEKQHPHDARKLDLASEMFDHQAAAIETAGITLAYVYYELSQRPDLQASLRAELLSLSPPLLYPHDLTNPISSPHPKSVDALPILDAILQETLRRWPVVAGGQRRVTPKMGTHTLAGYTGIPGGVKVQSSAGVLQMNPAVFPEPGSWRPERWMGGDEARLGEMKRWFWAWSSGGRMCIGRHFATLLMKHAIAAIYTNYTSSIIDAEGIEQGEGFSAGPKGNKVVLQFVHV